MNNIDLIGNDYLTTSEVAYLLGYSRSYIIYLSNVGKLKCTKTFGKMRMFLKNDVINYLDEIEKNKNK